MMVGRNPCCDITYVWVYSPVGFPHNIRPREKKNKIKIKMMNF
jgi:hypothetical protein